MIASVESHLSFDVHPHLPKPRERDVRKRADLDLHITLLAEHEITKFFNWYRSQWNGLASAMAIAHERKKIVRGLTFRTELIRSIATAHG
jgi:hypothetical protein